MIKDKKRKELTIGSKIFVVHKNYSGKKIPGGQVLSARIIAFQNVKHKIVPIFKVSNLEKSANSYPNMYDWFIDIEDAIKAIIS